MDISQDETTIRINDLEFNVSDYVEIIPDQAVIIEFLLLTVFCSRAEDVEKTIDNTREEFKDKTIFSVDEACRFTGYKKSYIYKLHSERKLKGQQSKPGAKLTFRRRDLETLMFKYSNIDI